MEATLPFHYGEHEAIVLKIEQKRGDKEITPVLYFVCSVAKDKYKNGVKEL